MKRFALTLTSARWIREQDICVARMRIRAFSIITAILAFPLQASSASTAASPPLPPPRPAEAPSHPAPNDLAPAEQTERAPPSTKPAWIVSAPPESNLSRSRFLRLSTRNVPSRRPCGSRPSNCHRGGERRSAYPKSRRFPVSSVNGSAIGCATSSLRSLPASSRSNSSRFTRDRVTNAATATAQRSARSAECACTGRRAARATASPQAVSRGWLSLSRTATENPTLTCHLQNCWPAI